MDFQLFINPTSEKLIKLISSINYVIEENSVYCNFNQKFVGFHEGDKRKIHICTNNIKNIIGWNLPTSPRYGMRYKNSKLKSNINKVINHEIVHVIQQCKGTNIININNISDKVLDRKLLALKGSYEISNNLLSEAEAYSIESNPKLIEKSFKKYCMN